MNAISQNRVLVKHLFRNLVSYYKAAIDFDLF